MVARMGMSIHVVGIKPPDEDYQKKVNAYRALEAAGIDIPRELEEFFNWTPPDPAGVVVQVPTKDWQDEDQGGYEVTLADLDPTVKVLRFYCSW